MVVRQRYVSAKWGISADVITMGLFGGHIVSKHLVKLMGSQKKQEVIVGHRGVQSYWASPCCCILFYFLSFFFSLLFLVLAGDDEGGEIFSAKSQSFVYKLSFQIAFFVYIRYFKSLPNAILDV